MHATRPARFFRLLMSMAALAFLVGPFLLQSPHART